jgi:hypothetical protein
VLLTAPNPSNDRLETLGQISRGGAWLALNRASVVAMDRLKDTEKAEKYLAICRKIENDWYVIAWYAVEEASE